MRSDLYAMALAAIFAALCYVTMLPLVGFYNVFLTLFICFTAGVLLGAGWGFLTGIIGMFLCSYFNPLGAALPPIMLAQMIGAGFSGWLGGTVGRRLPMRQYSVIHFVLMGAMGLVTALVYHLLVDVIDAWLWGPFWVRLQIGLISSLVTIVSNVIIFVVLFPMLKVLRGVVQYRR
ncbi:MAG: ECF transporter S component [candidate division Zixibacteria bacterium]|nr:ECF transporter S component [candidate division Zixibacteria bacterium]